MVVTAVAAVAVVFVTQVKVSAQEPAHRSAVTGATVTAGGNAGELVVSWGAHPERATDYRVIWAPAGENYRRYANSL